MEKGNPQLTFVFLKSVKVRGAEGSKELKSDVTSFQNMLTCEEANCSDNVPFICLGSQLVIVIKAFAGCSGEAGSSPAPRRRCARTGTADGLQNPCEDVLPFKKHFVWIKLAQCNFICGFELTINSSEHQPFYL